MPHITIEHSGLSADDLNIDELFDAIINSYSSCEAITPANVKMRAKGYDTARVAELKAPFIHTSIALMRGPSQNQLQALADAVHGMLCERYKDVAQVTLEIREMEPATYRKRAAS